MQLLSNFLLPMRESKVNESSLMNARIEEEAEHHGPNKEEESLKVEEHAVKEPVQTSAEEHFKRIRPTSWSPPPAEKRTTAQQNRHSAANVCKITVSPRSAPASLMVHRLQVSWSVGVCVCVCVCARAWFFLYGGFYLF